MLKIWKPQQEPNVVDVAQSSFQNRRFATNVALQEKEPKRKGEKPPPSLQVKNTALNGKLIHAAVRGQREDVDGNTGSDYRIQFSLKVNFDSGDLMMPR